MGDYREKWLHLEKVTIFSNVSEVDRSSSLADGLLCSLGKISAYHVDACFSDRLIQLLTFNIIIGSGIKPHRNYFVVLVKFIDQLFGNDVRIVLHVDTIDLHVIHVGQKWVLIEPALEVHGANA